MVTLTHTSKKLQNTLVTTGHILGLIDVILHWPQLKRGGIRRMFGTHFY